MQSKKTTTIEQLNELTTQARTIQSSADTLIDQLNLEAAKLRTGLSHIKIDNEDYLVKKVRVKLYKLVHSLSAGNEHQKLAAFHYQITVIYSELAAHLVGTKNIPKEAEEILTFYWYFLTYSHPVEDNETAKETVEHGLQQVISGWGELDDEGLRDRIINGHLIIQKILVEEGYRHETIEFNTKFLSCFL